MGGSLVVDPAAMNIWIVIFFKMNLRAPWKHSLSEPHSCLLSTALTAIWWRQEYHISGKPCTNSISGFCFAVVDRPPITRCNLQGAQNRPLNGGAHDHWSGHQTDAETRSRQHGPSVSGRSRTGLPHAPRKKQQGIDADRSSTTAWGRSSTHAVDFRELVFQAGDGIRIGFMAAVLAV